MTDLTIYKLIAEYKSNPLSAYRKKLRHHTRNNYDSTLRNLADQPIIAGWMRGGDMKLSDLDGPSFIGLHSFWAETKGQIPMGHSIISHLRMILRHGVVFLKGRDKAECLRLSGILGAMQFPKGKARQHVLTVKQIIAHRREAHQRGCPSIALVDALMFATGLRQKDNIGEYVPVSEKGLSDVVSLGAGKWLRGIRWENIDQHLVLSHITSKRGKPIVADLTLNPMVREELRLQWPGCIVEIDGNITVHRELLPASGPVIRDESTGLPWIQWQFAAKWRAFARAVGIPDHLQCRDLRATFITFALKHGASKDDTRKAATHSEAKQTDAYSRDDAAAAARVQRLVGESLEAEMRDAVA